jgi:hypothetical protein
VYDEVENYSNMDFTKSTIFDVAHESARTKLAFSSKQQDGFDNIFVTSVCIYIDILKLLRLLHDFYLLKFIEYGNNI